MDPWRVYAWTCYVGGAGVIAWFAHDDWLRGHYVQCVLGLIASTLGFIFAERRLAELRKQRGR